MILYLLLHCMYCLPVVTMNQNTTFRRFPPTMQPLNLHKKHRVNLPRRPALLLVTHPKMHLNSEWLCSSFGTRNHVEWNKLRHYISYCPKVLYMNSWSISFRVSTVSAIWCGAKALVFSSTQNARDSSCGYLHWCGPQPTLQQDVQGVTEVFTITDSNLYTIGWMEWWSFIVL